MLTLHALNAMPAKEFVAALAGIYEHSPWVAESCAALRPFANAHALQNALQLCVTKASFAQQLALLRAHPELASKAAVAQTLTAHSNAEQRGAGLTQCSAAEFAEINKLNSAYHEKFGWPFIIAVKGHTRESIIAAMAARLKANAADEFAQCIAQVGRIAALRLEQLLQG
jgi:2-oxo-4-hydroxy-4-carboxy-5-ureidoimidazoline decarboxylase